LLTAINRYSFNSNYVSINLCCLHKSWQAQYPENGDSHPDILKAVESSLWVAALSLRAASRCPLISIDN
jgi:hypothetical protein